MGMDWTITLTKRHNSPPCASFFMPGENLCHLITTSAKAPPCSPRRWMPARRACARTLRQTFSVVVEKTARELTGTACLELDEAEPPKQEICCSRMFGRRLEQLAPIEQAVATYVARAAEKLRAQGSVCKRKRVSIRTAKLAQNYLAKSPISRSASTSDQITSSCPF